ncbi:MAG: formylglycine-generating enzyme family protein [Deltaproteobacteria bacterium]|nr:MAG: formylglycine-generating enzyme family protein [Deltaproteobacteria bacterium]
MKVNFVMKDLKIEVCLYLLILSFFFVSGCSVKRGLRPSLPSHLTSKDGMHMVLIPAGEFMMGSENGEQDERPVHKVWVDAFYIDEHEVTVGQYRKFLQETGYPPPRFWNPELDKDNEPVVGISWYDACAYAKWAGKRLPTEAEWEKAARGGKQLKPFPYGDEISTELANYESRGISPVKSYPPNGYGLYDIVGNVWEWCYDWYDEHYYKYSPFRNPMGPVNGRMKVVRGGAWYSNRDHLRVSNRRAVDPHAKSYHIGFRCVISVNKLTKH